MNRLSFRLAAGLIAAVALTAYVDAQDRGFDRGGRDRGDRGDRGSWGSRGDRDSGERSRFGGFGGGSPWGGDSSRGFGGGSPFGGGPPGGFGGSPFGGGPPGGFSGGSPWGGGPPGGFGGSPWGGSSGGEDRSSRFTSMMDRNGNGQLDQEELDRMPSFFRDMMQSRGVELKAGMSLSDLQTNMRSSFTRSSSDGRDSSRDRSGRAETPVLKPYRQKEQERVTVDLPPKYSDLDTDYDGQLAFHEWLESRRSDIEQFDAIDFDADGFLTPRELRDYDAGSSGSSGSSSANLASKGIQVERLVIVTARGADNRGGSQGADRDRDRSNGDSRSRWGGSSSGDDATQMAQRYFTGMDRNQNGRIDMEEWESSRRLRPMFEQAGVRIAEMDQAEFTRNYASVASRSR